VLFILQKTNQSLQVCLDDFFLDFSNIIPTKSAFVQARVKLSYKVFKKLNRLLCKYFYDHFDYKKWKGFRVYAVDGSTLQLPEHASLSKVFSKHSFGPKANAPHWMSRISYLYDVLNGVVIDAQMKSYTTDEMTLCKSHLPFVRKGDLVIFDRYYASNALMFELAGKGVNFLFRMKNNWNVVKEFLKEKEQEKLIVLEVNPKHAKYKHLFKKYPHMKGTLQVRLLKRRNKKGEIEVFISSLTDIKKYSLRAVLKLYKDRWDIEEAYKLVKARLEVADFSGKRIEAVQQDFYAKSFLISINGMLRNKLKPNKVKRKNKKVKANTKEKSKKKRDREVNKTYLFSWMRKMFFRTYYKVENIEKLFLKMMKSVRKNAEYSRKGQYNERNFKNNGKYHNNYKTP